MVVNPNPLLSQIFYALGYLVAIGAFLAMARHRRLLTAGVVGLVPVALLAGLAGGTLLQYLFAGSDGKSILGAIAFGYAAVYFYKKRIGLNRPLGDLFAVALAAGEAIGRFGCLFAGCCYGKVTTGPFSIFQHDAYRYPTQIYLAVVGLAILIALLAAERTKRLPENGLFCLYGLLYCAGRFAVEFYRAGQPALFFLTAAQVACIAGAAFYAIYSLRLARLTPAYAQALP